MKLLLRCKVDGKWHKSTIHVPKNTIIVFRRGEVNANIERLRDYKAESGVKHFYPSRTGIHRGPFELSNKCINFMCCWLSKQFPGENFWRYFFKRVAGLIISERLREENWSNIPTETVFFVLSRLEDKHVSFVGGVSKPRGNVIRYKENQTSTISMRNYCTRFKSWLRQTNYEPFEFIAEIK